MEKQFTAEPIQINELETMSGAQMRQSVRDAPWQVVEVLARSAVIDEDVEQRRAATSNGERREVRGADAYNEALFSTVKQEEFEPQSHPLRPVRKWLNEALAQMDAKFSAMYEADVKGGRPSIVPEKLMHAMLLQVLYSVRSERQLVEQISYKLLFRCFAGSSGCRSRTRCGTTRSSARTEIG